MNKLWERIDSAVGRVDKWPDWKKGSAMNVRPVQPRKERKMTARERREAISFIDKASTICAKYGMILGNGGDISSMLSGISSELANGDARECAELADPN